MKLKLTITRILLTFSTLAVAENNSTGKGKLPDAVIETWGKIWRKDKTLNRSYTVNFEVYGEKSQNGDNSEVEIYIAVE